MNRSLSPAWHAQICGWIALAGPLAMGIWAASGWPRWQDDLAVVRDLGVVPIGGEGVISMVLAQLASLLPVGGWLLRATWVSAAALAVASRLVYGLVRQILARSQRVPGDSSWPSSVVALLAAGIFSVSSTAAAESTRIGGSLIALALLLLGMRLLEKVRDRSDARLLPLLGLLVGLAACESHAVGAVLLVAVGVMAMSQRGQPASGGLLFVVALCFSAGLGSMVSWLRPLSPNAWLNLGVGAVVVPEGQTPRELGGIVNWIVELAASACQALGGPMAALGALGVIVCLAKPSAIGRHFSPLLLILFGCLSPLFSVLGLERAATVCVLALAVGLIVQASLLVMALIGALRAAQLPYCQPVAPLALALGATLVLRGLDSLPVSETSVHVGAEAWSEEALGKLPPRALLLVRREATAYRLLASRVLHGTRPDVISVPAALLSRGSVAQDLLAMEPELSPLLRQLAVHGYADEYSLSRLADARPLFVELDSAWDRRLLEHLRPEPMWLGFSPHALGASDRVAGLKRSQRAMGRILEVSQLSLFDATTTAMLAGVAEQQALVLAGLGDRKGAGKALAILSDVDPDSAVLEQLTERLAQRSRGRVAVADLID